MRHTSTTRYTYLRRGLLAVLLLAVLTVRYLPGAGEWYARSIYPTLSAALSAVASLVPFSLEEITVVVAGLGLVLYPVVAYHKQRTSHRAIWSNEVELVLWVYVWFYIGWGLNYFRDSFFVRTGLAPVEYHEADFRTFLTGYTDSLNHTYVQAFALPAREVEDEVKALYTDLPDSCGLTRPRSYQHPKTVLLNPLYSAVGVLGYMGPFFAESQLNADLPDYQYPFTYAHELAHLLGVSSEAEANLWAYLICTRSASQEVRHAGYYGLLPYVLVNARSLLEKDDYRTWLTEVRPEVIERFKHQQAYWGQRYSPLVGSVQDKVYDWFLKGNRIASGQKNYAEVIHMLIARQVHEEAMQAAAPARTLTGEDISLTRDLAYDTYTLTDVYPYGDTTRCFKWEAIRRTLAFVENMLHGNHRWGVLQNYRNNNREAPVTRKYVRNAYGRVSDTLGVERYQSVPLYLPVDTGIPERYGRDGTPVHILGEEGSFSRIRLITDGSEWLLPQRYLKALADTTAFHHVVAIDRKDQNIATLERQAEGEWSIRSMNPATTGQRRPPYAQETPTGLFVLQEKKRKMFFLKDGSSAPGGYAPYASRFTNGAYIHGVPTNLPQTREIEYSWSLGTTPRSHMCVRNATSHAAFVYRWAPTLNTLVVVLE